MKITQRALLIIMVLVTLVSVVSISAQAATVEFKSLGLGYMVPTNPKGTKVIDTVDLYGTNDYINFYINSKKSNSYFFYEVYSDKKLTKQVDIGYVKCGKGEFSFSPEIKLKGVYKTKTYYALTYSAKVDSNGNIKVDSKSVRDFKIKVDRTTAFDKRVVTLNTIKNTYNGPKITWDKISGASKYYVYRRNIDGTKWRKVGTVGSGKNVFFDKSLKEKNGNYIYTVKAVNKNGVSSRYHYAGLVCLFAKAPVIASVSTIADNAIQVEWNQTKSGAKYTVMRKEKGGKWETLKTNVTATTYKDTTAENNKTYQYTIKATLTTDYGKTTSGYFTTNGEKIKYLQAPELNDVCVVDTGVNISWNAVEGVSAYKVFRRPLDKSENWTELGTVDSTFLEFTDTTADLESAYIYTVRSEGESKKGSFYSEGMDFVVLDSPTDVTCIYNTEIDGIEVQWQDVTFADRYNLYVMDENGQWQLAKSVKDTFGNLCFTSFIPENYGTIRYTVTALRDGTNETAIGEAAYEMDFYPRVDIKIAEIRTEGNLLRWNDKGAQSYNVYRSVASEDPQYELIKTIEVANKGEKINFVDENVPRECSYTYVIKGVYDGVEQTNFYATKTLSKANVEGIERNENVFFYRNQYSKSIKLGPDASEYEKEYYVYNYEKDYWTRINSYKQGENTALYLTEKTPTKDGKYTIGVVYKINDSTTPINSFVYTGDFYDVAFEKVSAKAIKKGIRISWKEIVGAEKYILRYSLKGSDEITESIEIPVNESGNYNFDFERNIKKVSSVKFIIEAVDAESRVTAISKSVTTEATPVLYGAERKDNGEVWVYWNYYWQGQDFIVMRKTEDGSWKKIAKNCNPFHAKKYNGKKCSWFVDRTAKEGVKYTYTVIAKGTGDMGDYMHKNSYYDTKGITLED